MSRLVFGVGLIAFASSVLGCGGSSVPDPKDAVRAYAQAAARGDADAMYAMLSEQGQRSLSRQEMTRIVLDEKTELADQAKALESPATVIKARARVRFADGEDATLELERDGFRISSADALPVGARSPVQALSGLRRVLARRSYAGLMRVLSPATRSAVENDLRALVTGLENPEGLEIEVAGDRATVQVPGGHEVKLRREAGVWYVEDFD